MTLKDRVLALLVEWTGLQPDRIAAELGVPAQAVVSCCFQLAREGRVCWGNGPAAGRVLLREPRPELAWPPEQPWTPAGGPVGRCVECGDWTHTLDEARQPCHPNCGTGTGTATHDQAIALMPDVLLGGVVIYDGPPIPPRTRGPAVGPCATCRTRTRRYGPGAGPLCATCRAALPIDPPRRYLRQCRRPAPAPNLTRWPNGTGRGD